MIISGIFLSNARMVLSFSVESVDTWNAAYTTKGVSGKAGGHGRIRRRFGDAKTSNHRGCTIAH